MRLPTQDSRQLSQLDGVGPETLADFRLLGIASVRQLARCEPAALYAGLCLATGANQDPCVLDVFTCAVAQARDPSLPKSRRRWWYWSQRRKAGK